MTDLFRRRVIKLLVQRELLAEDFARNLLSWKHSGFSIDNSVRILDESSQESLAEYIARPPISLKKIRYEPFKGRVLFHTTYSEYFKENLHMFDALIASDRSSSTARTVIVAVFWVESLSWKPFSVALRDSFSYNLMTIPNVDVTYVDDRTYPSPFGDGLLDSYMVVNASLTVDVEPFNVAFRVENLFNADYELVGRPNATADSFMFGRVQRYFATLKLNF